MISDKTDLPSVLARIRQQYGAGAIMQQSDSPTWVDYIPTGALHLDSAIGCGGYPRGRIVEIFGPESSGKTTLALTAIANCQAQGGTAAFIDAEHAFDPAYARAIGVQLDKLLISQPDDGEQALDIVEQLTRSGAVALVVVDSVASLTPRAEVDGEMGDSSVGLQARLMSQAMRKLAGPASRNNTCILFTNQLRQKVGVTFGNAEVTTGGNALKFYASLRLDVRRIGAVRKGEAQIGSKVRVRVVKNKLAPPFRAAEFDIIWGEGICNSRPDGSSEG